MASWWLWSRFVFDLILLFFIIVFIYGRFLKWCNCIGSATSSSTKKMHNWIIKKTVQNTNFGKLTPVNSTIVQCPWRELHTDTHWSGLMPLLLSYGSVLSQEPPLCSPSLPLPVRNRKWALSAFRGPHLLHVCYEKKESLWWHSHVPKYFALVFVMCVFRSWYFMLVIVTLSCFFFSFNH